MRNIVNIPNERNDHEKISRKSNGHEGQKRSKMTKKQNKLERLSIKRQQNDTEESNKDKKEFEFGNNSNTENRSYGKELEKIEWTEALQIPGLLINIREKCISTMSSFQILSDTLREYHSHCCNAFRKYPNVAISTEKSEECAAITYAISKLLFRIGYNPERIAVSGLDTLIMLAAKNAMKLDDACFAWKTIASLIKNGGNSTTIAEQINTVLLKLDINFQRITSLINFQQLILSDTESLTSAILTSDEENQQFLDNRIEPYMTFGSRNDYSVKHIEKFDDFVAFITSQKDSKFLEVFQKTLIEKEN
ncbi:unnamed protein product, partial [Onchocerca flexuosa]|uniref:Fatty-acid synthase system n=1 Tax=Onchocerca flexuosa TaxID=387005 RepID=A0A183HTH4_9BILA